KNQEARIAFLRGQLTKGKAGDSAAMEKELIELESNPIIVPGRVQIWTQDITPERLGAIMAENNESIAILSAEGGIFENIGGRYSGSVPNLDVFLQAHAGDAVRVDRGSREPVFMQSPALTMGLSVQPGILSELARHRAFRSLGLWARFLFAVPRSPLGYRTLNTTPISPPVSHSFNQMVRNLLSSPCRCDDDGKSQPFILKLEGEAHAMWKIFSQGVEKQLADGGDFEHIRDWAGKLPGQAVRIAGLLHCMEQADKSPWTVPISDQTMDKALNLAATFSVHAQSVFDLMGATVEMMAAMKIWNWVKRNRLEQFTKRDCYQALKGSFQKVAELEPGLSLLVERSYLRDVPLAQTGAGRKKELYEVNPSLTEQWQ
ncbi:MAG: YfjI family protein, partial [Desulforhabdus sp.]|nr:YfjI family protein [Desulforhabdus sp.]